MFSVLKSYVLGTEQEQLQTQFEKDRKGSQTIDYRVDDINFDHLRRKRAFIKGKNIQLAEEFDKEELVGFDNIPDLLPVIPKGNIATLSYEELMAPVAGAEEEKSAAEAGSATFNYDTDDTAARSSFLDRFDLVSTRQIQIKGAESKPAAIILNSYTTGSRSEEI